MKLNLLWLFIWLSLTCGSQITKAQDEINELILRQHREVKVCGGNSDKNFQISLYAGEIKSSDGFNGITAYLKYDPKKISFGNVLRTNTLAEFFDYYSSTPKIIEYGVVEIFAGTLGTVNANGDKAIIAVNVTFLGECPTTTTISIDRGLDISDDIIKNKIRVLDSHLVIEVKKKEDMQKGIEVDFIGDGAIDFEKDTTVEIMVNLNTNWFDNVDSLDFELGFGNRENFSLDNIESVQKSIIIDTIITEINNDSVKYQIRIHLTNAIINENAFKMIFSRKMKLDDSLEVDFKIKNVNFCSCGTKFENDKVMLISKKVEDTTLINEFENKEIELINSYYDDLNDDFMIRMLPKKIKKIEIYNIDGRRILENEINGMRELIKIEAEDFTNGVYLLKMYFSNGFENNIVLIKN